MEYLVSHLFVAIVAFLAGLGSRVLYEYLTITWKRRAWCRHTDCGSSSRASS